MPLFSAPVDLARNELRNAVTQNLSAAPALPIPGLRYYNTVSNDEQYWNGIEWVTQGGGPIDVADIVGLGALAYLDQVGTTEIAPLSITDAQVAANAAIALTKLAVNPLDRANHTGTQLAATISDFDTQVRTNPINLLASPTNPLNMGGQTITSLGSPTLPSDAANKTYVDSMVSSGIDIHPAVRAATTGPIVGWSSVMDGVTLVNGDRILVKDQIGSVANGIYVFDGAAASRAPDADAGGELNSGTYVLVTEGDVNRNSGWIVTSDSPIVIDTDPIVWQQFSAGGASYVGTTDRISIIGTQIDIAATYTGQASLSTLGTVTTGVWNGSPIDISHGGTGATTVADARVALGAIGKYTTTVGDGAAKTFTVTHSLNTKLVGVEMYERATGQTVYADVRRTTVNDVVIDGFNVAPVAGALDVVIWG